MGTYRVRAGDTLSRIAARFKTTWQRLFARNRRVIGSNPNRLKIGEVLQTSAPATKVAPKPVAKKAPAPVKKAAAPAKPKPPATQHTTYDGHVVNEMTKAALDKVAVKLGYKLTLLQGSYNGTAVAASAGTHARGGVVDLAPYDWERKVRALREVGFAAWHRLPSEGPWGEHIHAVLIGDPDLAPAAAQQVTAYKNGRNGLANNGPDTFSYRPNPIKPFVY